MLNLSQYARWRRAKGLSGGTGAAVKKAIDSKRIVRGRDGLIDAGRADDDWRRNTAERATDVVPSSGVPKATPTRWNAEGWAKFRAGIGWISEQVCATARRVWPEMVRESWDEMSPVEQTQLTELLCGSLEEWLAADRVAGCVPDTGIEFLAGARHQAQTICIAGRQRFPGLIVREIFGPDGERHSPIHLTATVLSLCEGWLGGYIHPEKLPPVDWREVFPDGAAAAAEEYRGLRQQWAAA